MFLKSLRFTSIIIGSLLLSGCAEMYSGLSNYNAMNGARCKRIGSNFSSYSPKEEKYLDNIIVGIHSEELLLQEKSWVKNKLYYYASRPTFGTYSETSPFSGNSYKFNTYCKSY